MSKQSRFAAVRSGRHPLVTTAAIVMFAAVLMAQWPIAANASSVPVPYIIEAIGFADAEHTRADGHRYSTPLLLNAAGHVLGTSQRFSGMSSQGATVWLFDGSATVNVGLTDTEHTRSDGYRYSYADLLNASGQVAGQAERFDGAAMRGFSAWLFDGSATLNIGLSDAAHTRADGHRESWVHQLNQAGQVRGGSDRYSGSTHLGSSAWLFDGATTIPLGFLDTEHTRSDGYRESSTWYLNEAGQVAGYSERFSGSESMGRSVWLYSSGTTLNIGLTDAEHTRNDGFRQSWIWQLNEAGQVSGESQRFSGLADHGKTASLHGSATTVNIGLVDTEHTRDDGYRYSEVWKLNQAGQVVGESHRYTGAVAMGRSTWFFNGATTVVIGLTDAEHTRSDGYRDSWIWHFNEAGQAAGGADRYNGTADMGWSAWLFSGGSTTNIGLIDAEHTRSDGYREAWTVKLNEAGWVIGASKRYDGASDAGWSAWLYNGTATANIGLADAVHTRDDGYRYNEAVRLNAIGQVAGYSERFDGPDPLGRTGWVFDPLLGATVALLPSTRSDGYGFSEVSFLGDDGVALGYYELYDGMDLLGQRAFYWTRNEGLWDLGTLVDGGLAGQGWTALYTAIQGNSLDQIIGTGLLSDMPSGSMAYLLTPVPEPGSIFLLVAGAVGLLALVRRKRIPRR